MLVALGLTTFDVIAAEWPEHLTLHEESRSPDGHYGIVVSTSSHVDDGKTVLLAEEGEEFVDYFADLQTHRLLGKSKGFEYVEGANHAHLDVEWTPDSTLCIATDWGRYGFSSLAVLEPKQNGFAQADLGQRIQKSLGELDGCFPRKIHVAENHSNHSEAEQLARWLKRDALWGSHATWCGGLSFLTLRRQRKATL